jgi:hypothetical protein
MKPARPPAEKESTGKRSAFWPIVMVAGVALLILLAAGGHYLVNRRSSDAANEPPSWIPALPSAPPPVEAPAEPVPTATPPASIAEGLQALARQAAAADAPDARAIATAAASAAKPDSGLQGELLAKLTRSRTAAFAAALAREADVRSARVARLAAWADPDQPATQRSPKQRAMAGTLHSAHAAVTAAAARVRNATEAAQSLAAARAALDAYSRFREVYARAYTLARGTPAPDARPATTTATPPPAPSQAAVPISAAELKARVAEFKQVHDSAKAIGGQIAALGRTGRPRSSDGEAARAAYWLRQDNAARARQYADHLNQLARSLRGAKTDAAAEGIVAQARTVRGYLVTLQQRSAAALGR